MRIINNLPDEQRDRISKFISAGGICRFRVPNLEMYMVALIKYREK